MNEHPTTASHEPHHLPPPAVPPNLQIRAALLLLLMLALVVGAIIYVMYARGVFEATQKLVLVADDSEGVVVGMDLTFSGFPIGRVSQIELSPEGNARMIVDVPRKDAHWLRKSSVFTLERGLVGNTRMRAHTGILTDPLLEDGASRKLLVGDASAEIPRLVSTAKELIENLKSLTAADSSLDASLGNVKTLTEKLNGKNGALDVLLGDEKNVQKLLTTLDRTNTLLVKLDGFAAKADGLAGKADTQVFGPNGLMKDTQATVTQLNAMLTDVRESLKKVDKVLIETQAVSENIKLGTTDLGALRADVDVSLRKVDQLVNEINRKWPFKRDAEIKLP
jgi:phospholipid/cholesterol/gamma-HCH transport system substrate-binding protein